MKKQTKKLTLRAETLRNVAVPELANVIGGGISQADMTTCVEAYLVATSSPTARGGRCDTDFIMKKPTSCDQRIMVPWYLK